MEFVLDFDPPFVHVEEEELVNARDIFPPSFFTESANSHNFHFPFVEPPPRARSLPSTTQSATKPPHHSYPQHPLIPSTSISRSPSSETTSTQPESATTDEDPITSPVIVSRGLDRPRLHKTLPQTMFPSRGGFKRIPGTASPEAPSSVPESSRISSSHGTLRRIDTLPSDQFRIATRDFAARRPASARGELAFARKPQTSSAEEKPSRIPSDTGNREGLTQQDAQKRVVTD